MKNPSTTARFASEASKFLINHIANPIPRSAMPKYHPMSEAEESGDIP